MIPYWIVAVAALATALTGCTSTQTKQGDNALFEMHEIETPEAMHQTVLAGNFDGSGRAQLAAVMVDPSRSLRLRLIARAGGEWSTALDGPLDRAVLFVDIARDCGVRPPHHLSARERRVAGSGIGRAAPPH